MCAPVTYPNEYNSKYSIEKMHYAVYGGGKQLWASFQDNDFLVAQIQYIILY